MSFKEIKLIENVTSVNLPLWAQRCMDDIAHDPASLPFEQFPHNWDSAPDYCPAPVVH